MRIERKGIIAALIGMLLGMIAAGAPLMIFPKATAKLLGVPAKVVERAHNPHDEIPPEKRIRGWRRSLPV